MLGKIEGRRRRGQQRMRWLDGITDSMQMRGRDREAWSAVVHGVSKSRMQGASVRNSACGKGHEEGGLAYAKVGSSLRVPLEILEHLPPKPESAYFIALCSHLHLWLYGGLSPTTSFGEGVNLELQLIIISGRDRSVSTYKLLWRFSSLPDRFVRPHVIVHSLPPVRRMRCSKLSKNRFFWEVRKLLV